MERVEVGWCGGPDLLRLRHPTTSFTVTWSEGGAVRTHGFRGLPQREAPERRHNDLCVTLKFTFTRDFQVRASSCRLNVN